ncbi:unnamed protein product [Sphagnum compactum]
MPALAEAGFLAIALDMRGYGESEAPDGIENSTSFHVVGDIIGVLDALGEKQCPIPDVRARRQPHPKDD